MRGEQEPPHPKPNPLAPHIFVRHQDGLKVRFDVIFREPVRHLQQRIDNRFHVRPRDQRLSHNKTPIDPHKKLSDYHLPNGAIIDLKVVHHQHPHPHPRPHPHHQRIIVFVKHPNRAVIRLNVRKTEPVRHIKDSVQKRFNIPIKQQRLFYHGDLLNINERISDHHIPNRGVIDLIITDHNGETPARPKPQPRPIPEHFHIFIHQNDGSNIRMNVEPNDPVNHIQKRIADILHVPVKEQNLSYNKTPLDSNKKLSDYRVPNAAILNLHVDKPQVGHKTFLVNIHHPNGEHFRMFVRINEDVKRIKRKIQQVWHIPLRKQVLTFNKTPLDIHKRISDYHVPYGGDLHIVFNRPRPRPQPRPHPHHFIVFVRHPDGHKFR